MNAYAVVLGKLIKAAKAKSKKQQKLMGMVHAVQKGEMRAPSGKVREMADSMTSKAVTDYAETKRKGLPEKAPSKKASLFTVALLRR